ncbi:MAG: hypothetical protein JW915_24470 [Chitinispirillaceae bacterium]|nr:hypothetical protein [Chitinispirillaceae bacterium]
MTRIRSISMCALMVAVTGLFMVSCDFFKKQPDIKEAKKAEVTGKIAEALAIYADVLLASTPSFTLPDFNRSKFLKPEQWRKEVEDYQVWIHSAEQKIPENYQTALDGVMSCNREENTANRLLRLKTEEITVDNFKKEWNRVFFAQMAKVDSSHEIISSGAFSKKVSYVKLSSPKNYTYTIQLLSLNNKRRIEAVLYPETDVTFMALPGEYLLLIRSSVTFESGQLWISPYSSIPLTVPQEASMITADLMTRVSR